MYEIEFFGIVGREITHKGFLNELKKADGDELSILFNSSGGDVEQGLGIQSAVVEYEGNVSGTVIGLAASTTSWVAMACDSLSMNEHALFNVHECMAGIEKGHYNKGELSKHVRELEKIDANFVSMYSSKTNIDREELEELMKADELITAEEALEYGFINKINPVTAVAPINIGNLLKSKKFEKFQDRLTALANCSDGSVKTDPEKESLKRKLKIQEERNARLLNRMKRKKKSAR